MAVNKNLSRRQWEWSLFPTTYTQTYLWHLCQMTSSHIPTQLFTSFFCLSQGLFNSWNAESFHSAFIKLLELNQIVKMLGGTRRLLLSTTLWLQRQCRQWRARPEKQNYLPKVTQLAKKRASPGTCASWLSAEHPCYRVKPLVINNSASLWDASSDRHR